MGRSEKVEQGKKEAVKAKNKEAYQNETSDRYMAKMEYKKAFYNLTWRDRKLKRLELFSKANYMCEECSRGEEFHAIKLLIHRKIKPDKNPKLIFDPSNCHVLCFSCHKKAENNKELYKKYF